MGSRTLLGAALLALVAMPLPAQEASPASPFMVDLLRVQPREITFDIIVHRGDSTITIGQRRVVVTQSSYTGAPAWLIVETRAGAVPVAESLHVSTSLRPIRWTSQMGTAQLTFQVARDSLFGGTTGPAGRQAVIAPAPADLILSTAMVEVLLAAAPLSADWKNSVNVLRIDHASWGVMPGELLVIGEEYMGAPAWIAALRAGVKSVVFWIDKATGQVTRSQQPLPLHVGSLLEYRSRNPAAPDSTSTTTPP